MIARKSITILTVALFATAIPATPSLAQHGGGGHNQNQGMHDQAGGMHSGEMMEQMTTMMDHMSEMIGDMHELHEQFGTMMQGQEHMGGMAGDHGAMMQPMVEGMDEMMPHMENMVNHMRSFMDKPHDEPMGESMGILMKQMDAMLVSSRDAMKTIHNMAVEKPGSTTEADHSGHNH